jgi:tRNA(adenine34) deaminase
MEKIDLQYMQLALKVAERGGQVGEVPVGAVLVCGADRFVAYNLREGRNDPTAHAELLAIRKGAKKLSRWRLGGTLYVTLEPCAMCAGAILEARIDKLVFGAFDPKAGGCGSVWNIIDERKVRHLIFVTGGVMAEESKRLLKEFFAQRRAVGKKAIAGQGCSL